MTKHGRPPKISDEDIIKIIKSLSYPTNKSRFVLASYAGVTPMHMWLRLRRLEKKGLIRVSHVIGTINIYEVI